MESITNTISPVVHFNRKRRAPRDHQDAPQIRKRNDENAPRHYHQKQQRQAHQRHQKRRHQNHQNQQRQNQDHRRRQVQGQGTWNRGQLHFQQQYQWSYGQHQSMHSQMPQQHQMPPNQAAPRQQPGAVQEKKSPVNLSELVKNLEARGFISSSSPRSEDDIWGSLKLSILKRRDTKAIEGILTRRQDACGQCGMKLDDSKGRSEAWKRHMDQHFWDGFDEAAKKPKGMRRATSQPWYSSKLFEGAAAVEKRPEPPIRDVISSGSSIRNCAVCDEVFQQYFDEEEEYWYFRSSTEANGLIVHRECAPDAHNGGVVAKIEVKSETKYYC